MHQIDPQLSGALVSIGISLLMVRVGIGKRMLAWRPNRERRNKRWRR
jgi:DNA-binding IclR family transcriptional regulator